MILCQKEKDSCIISATTKLRKFVDARTMHQGILQTRLPKHTAEKGGWTAGNRTDLHERILTYSNLFKSSKSNGLTSKMPFLPPVVQQNLPKFHVLSIATVASKSNKYGAKHTLNASKAKFVRHIKADKLYSKCLLVHLIVSG